jgi:hypothetical protein
MPTLGMDGEQGQYGLSTRKFPKFVMDIMVLFEEVSSAGVTWPAMCIDEISIKKVDVSRVGEGVIDRVAEKSL